jgi:flagellar protein FlgJ
MQVDIAQVYTDFEGLTALKAKARNDRHAALDQVARQFESLFLQMMLKSMRDASMGGGLLDSKQSEFYRDMYDKQIAVNMSQQHGIGLADVIKQQLGDGVGSAHRDLAPGDYRDMPIAKAALMSRQEKVDPATSVWGSESVEFDGTPEGFLKQLWPIAEQAAADLDVPPEALLAQAALETGWGKHVMRQVGGGSSHNLFGIKADSRWCGDAVPTSTLEYQGGVAVKTRANFRAYDSYAESFKDYVGFLQGNPRYREALTKTDDPAAYFSALQEAGYATDPRYAEKILRVLDSEPMRRAKDALAEQAVAPAPVRES